MKPARHNLFKGQFRKDVKEYGALIYNSKCFKGIKQQQQKTALSGHKPKVDKFLVSSYLQKYIVLTDLMARQMIENVSYSDIWNFNSRIWSP